MGQIIASSYEIVQRLGSGGGGIVYLARHLRLGKWVVLKADKRTLAAKPEMLRREVDALKDLSHTYIPQVYDFVVDGDTVYTVMDYIEGESLNKPLQRGERFSQVQVISWACQLLEALCYLHSRPPHGILHSDIKPANIMLTPQGDIRLIDFNIALVLGEEGAVRVGFSQGYASPEHYGLDYSGISATQPDPAVETRLTMSDANTVLSTSEKRSSGSSSRRVLLDVRSDIYSLGATLYHLLTGRRPANDADRVEQISDPAVSPAVAAIVRRAMEPDPARRYQSAAEMLYDFEHLHENDARTRRQQKCFRVTMCVLAGLFLLGGFTALAGLRQMNRAEEAARLAAQLAQQEEREAKEQEQREKAALEALSASEAALRDGDVTAAVELAMQALEEDTVYAAQAQRALTDALGVYDLTDGFRAHLRLELPSEPLKAVLSPAGTRVAALVSGQVLVFDTDTGAQLAALEADASALSDVVFPSEDLLLYAGRGALRAYDLAQERELWSGQPTTGITLSGDGSTAAAVYKDENQAAVYDVATGAVLRVVAFQEARQSVAANDIFADPEDSVFRLNGDGSLLAVSFSGGGLRIFDLRDSGGDLEIFDESEFTHFEGGFHDRYFAFAATGGESSVFAVIDTVEMAQTGGFSSTMPFHTLSDESGVYVATEDVLVRLDPVTGEQQEAAYTGGAEIRRFCRNGSYLLVVTADGDLSIFDANAVAVESHTTGERCDLVDLAGDYVLAASLDTLCLRLLRREEHQSAQVLCYAPEAQHNEARLSADGSTVMLFRYDHFWLYGADGQLLTEVDIPDAEQVYDQQYRRDGSGSYLEVIYYSGLTRCYAAEDGRLLREEQGEVPDDTLYEEFFTDTLRITSPLHGTPVAYDRQTGEKLRELEQDAYLTYVTQVGTYTVTEYITAEGQRYGLLLDEQCETLAYLPDLCDITADGRLIFDDMMGTLRQSRIYSKQELKALATN